MTASSSSSSSSSHPTRWVVPGMRLCAADEDRHQAGRGTYVLHGYIYSSLAGKLNLVQNKEEDGQGKKNGKEDLLTVEVVSPKRERTVIPAQGDVVTAKVLSVNPRIAKLHILCVRDLPLPEPFRAQLRKEDVRATEKDRVEMYRSFRPGDIILARVLSLGEASSGYLLATAENELGVVIAHSEVLSGLPEWEDSFSSFEASLSS